LPFDAVEVEPLLKELAGRGFILRYQVEGRSLIQIVNFLKHQNPHHREAESDLPSPESLRLDPHSMNTKPEASPGIDPQEVQFHEGQSRLIPDSLIPDSLIPDSLIPDSREARASRLPPTWLLPDDWRKWAEEVRPDIDVALTADKFRDYWIAKPGKEGRKLDWLATWRTWVRKEDAPGPRAHKGAGRPASCSSFESLDYRKDLHEDGSIIA